MNVLLKESQGADIPFMREMLYEAVYWRPNPDKPSFEKGLACPGVSSALGNWGERDGDIAVIAFADSTPAGAAWLRLYTDEEHIRGYIDRATPVLVIAVHKEYRLMGVGEKMIHWLIEHAAEHNIERISLMVSKDNHAIELYRKCGFLQYADKEDSFLMVRALR